MQALAVAVLALVFAVLTAPWVFALFFAESWLAWRLNAKLFERSGTVFWTFPEPTPVAFAVRSFGQRGRILLSQGLLAPLTEREIEVLARLGSEELHKRGTILRSVSAVLRSFVLDFTPNAWRGLLARQVSSPEFRGADSWRTVAGFIPFLMNAWWYRLLSLPARSLTGHDTVSAAVVAAASRKILDFSEKRRFPELEPLELVLDPMLVTSFDGNSKHGLAKA